MAGIVLWRGASALDGRSPLVLVITSGSRNTKTGDMDQAWILRTDIPPWPASRNGDDAAICGDCRHRRDERGGRSCYVNLSRAPNHIFNALDTYPKGFAKDLSGRTLRISAYGDPVAVPIAVWEPLFDYLKGWTGYTHQWRTADRAYKRFLMASVDTEAEFVEAQRDGWRTFRVRQTPGLLPGEIVCPASAEAGHRTTCESCRLCSGHARQTGAARSIAIYIHGRGTSAFSRRSQIRLALVTD